MLITPSVDVTTLEEAGAVVEETPLGVIISEKGAVDGVVLANGVLDEGVEYVTGTLVLLMIVVPGVEEMIVVPDVGDGWTVVEGEVEDCG
jgi:hypothetical protein